MQVPTATAPRAQPLQSPSGVRPLERLPASPLTTSFVNKDNVDSNPPVERSGASRFRFDPSSESVLSRREANNPPAERFTGQRFWDGPGQEAPMFRRERADSMDRIDNSDEESVGTSRSDHRYEKKGDVLRPAQPEPPGDPLFMQYPIGDGCYVVLAMYVEKDAATALKRFPTLQRTRLLSAPRARNLEQMANIFKEALEEEKEACLG